MLWKKLNVTIPIMILSQRRHISVKASQLTSLSIICSTAWSFQQQWNIIFKWWMQLAPVDSPQKGPVMQKTLPCHDAIMLYSLQPYPFVCRPVNNQADAIWRQRSGSTLAQVMACCLTAPSHYLNQCWLIISKVEWHLSKCNFTRDTSAINH